MSLDDLKNNPFIELHQYDKSEADFVLENPETESIAEAGSVILKPIVVKGKKLLPENLSSADSVSSTVHDLENDLIYTVIDIAKKQMSIKPKAPFTTSTLQQAASSKLGSNPKITMQIAQKLYEGVELDGKSTALITYMRTDSVTLSKDATENIKEFIAKTYPKFQFDGNRIYKSKSKNAQEAHEAIRPTNVTLTPESIKGKIEPRLWKVYDLIWKQTVSSLMADEVREITTFTLENSEKSQFNGSSTQTIFLGWKAVYAI
jgi:DNA topoisomerase I